MAMMRARGALAALALVAALAGGDGPTRRRPYPFYGDAYYVEFPGKPNLSARAVRRPGLPTRLHVESVPHLGDFRYWVAEGALRAPPTDPGRVLESLRREAIAELGGRVVREQEADPPGGRGRELWLELPGRRGTAPREARVRVVVRGDRVYIAASEQPAGKAGRPEEAERFHASFRPGRD